MTDLNRFVRETFASHVQISQDTLFAPQTTLADVVAASDRIQNSVDLMEAFAKTANALRRKFQIVVRLPAFALDTPVVEVLDALLSEVEAARREDRTVGA